MVRRTFFVSFLIEPCKGLIHLVNLQEKMELLLFNIRMTDVVQINSLITFIYKSIFIFDNFRNLLLIVIELR